MEEWNNEMVEYWNNDFEKSLSFVNSSIFHMNWNLQQHIFHVLSAHYSNCEPSEII